MTRCVTTLISILCLASSIGCTDESEVAAADYRVQVFGCYLPIPAQYVLNATTDEYYFYDSSDDGFGSFSINDYDEKGLSELLEISDVLGQEEKDGLVAMLIASHLEGAPAEGFQSAILHDYDRVFTIVGDEVPNWRTMFKTCLDNPGPS